MYDLGPMPVKKEYFNTKTRKDFQNHVFNCNQLFIMKEITDQIPHRHKKMTGIIDFSGCNLHSSFFESCHSSSSCHKGFRVKNDNLYEAKKWSIPNVIIFFGADLRNTAWLSGLLEKESRGLEKRRRKVCFFNSPEHSAKCSSRETKVKNEMYVNLYNSSTKFPDNFDPRNHPRTWVRIEDGMSSEDALEYIFDQLVEYQDRPRKKTLLTSLLGVSKNIGGKTYFNLNKVVPVIVILVLTIAAAIWGISTAITIVDQL